MPRQARESSGTGIYHVMMRGINHQNIFEEQEDYYQFLTTLDVMAQSYEPDGTPAGRNYILYAYCLMSNHIHLLIREREDTIGMAIKRIASSYVYYYNHKYSRDGHLFRERFKSEPVNDMSYFLTLLRYIHQNPLKAGMVERVKEYEFSSWGEYIDKDSTLFPLCDTRTVLSRIPFNDLDELVNDPLSDDIFVFHQSVYGAQLLVFGKRTQVYHIDFLFHKSRNILVSGIDELRIFQAL